jgi:hypothetical protein
LVIPLTAAASDAGEAVEQHFGERATERVHYDDRRRIEAADLVVVIDGLLDAGARPLGSREAHRCRPPSQPGGASTCGHQAL